MKNLKRVVLLLLVLCPSFLYAGKIIPAEVYDKLRENMALRSSSQGTKFIITIPPNEKEKYSSYDQLCAVYVAASTPTRFTIYTGANKTLDSVYNITDLLGVVTINISTADYELRKGEIVDSTRTIIIESEHPISVYVINAKNATSDGYLAIPVSAWGKEYIHCSYYDNNEAGYKSDNFNYASGFIVMAAEDSTVVNINARGLGSTDDMTEQGHIIGDVWRVVLNSGECYMVKGQAANDGKFDLSGTLIQADKPIGLISFHERAGLPWNIDNSRNCLSEMMLPVAAWKNRYVSVVIDRGDFGRGDIYRVVASEAATKCSIKWYNPETLQLTDSIHYRLGKAGEFFEYTAYPGKVAETNMESITGVAVFEADKPIMVMQYSPEEGWDNASEAHDPFMVIVPAVEQYAKATVIQAPVHEEFYDNQINLIVRGDTNDLQRNELLLKSLTIDSIALFTKAPELLTNRIPNTDLYFIQGYNVENGPHYISAKTEFGGFMYGRKSVDSYGWPLSMNINADNKIDTIAPICYKRYTIGNFKIRFTELDDPIQAPNSLQKQSGVAEYPLLLSGSYNFKIPEVAPNFTLWPPNFDSYFNLKVDDDTKEGKAIFMVVDLKGNYTIDSVFYDPKLSVNENRIEGYSMQNVMPNPVDDNQFIMKFTIGNSSSPTKIEMLNLNGELVKLISNELMNSGEHNLTVSAGDLPSGTYLVKITSGAYIASQKVVIVK